MLHQEDFLIHPARLLQKLVALRELSDGDKNCCSKCLRNMAIEKSDIEKAKVLIH
jgi:hypothetical protein